MVFLTLLVLAALSAGGQSATHRPPTTTPFPHVDLMGRIQGFQTSMDQVMRQLMQQQLYVEERIRSDGQSGLKQLRQYHDGTRPYYSESHTYRAVAAVHNHANYDRTVGMGELNMVINGVDFRTRHNDYKLRMPNKTSSVFHALEDIPFPEVPPEVLAKTSLPEQVAELREWFRAWKDQDHSIRDYRKYFKAVLCYMEGAWTTSTKTIVEPFRSDRHAIDATSWHDLQEKIRFTSYSGSKSVLENFAYLPTTIMNVVNGTPEFAQWNYRILCHPIKRDVPLEQLHVQDDLGVRLAHGQTMEQFSLDRAARFSLYKEHGEKTYSLLDELMHEIPGKDNYRARLHENVFDEPLYDAHASGSVLLNSGYYHRWYKVGKLGTERKVLHRGFSDSNLWVAQTTQPQVAPLTVEHCTEDQMTHAKTCKSWTRRYTYAVPMEVIYMTPLYNWNPYNLEYKPRKDEHYVHDKTRVGGGTQATAYNGTFYNLYYHTPPEFFTGKEVSPDPADTTRVSVGVLDKQGNIKLVGASGTRIILPNIPGVGKLRTRYPIMPIHGEGSGVWKELDALKDMMMNMKEFAPLFEKVPSFVAGNSSFLDGPLLLMTGLSTRTPPGLHAHEMTLPHDAQVRMKAGRTETIYTDYANGHNHEIKIGYSGGHYHIVKCDGQSHCWDGHPAILHTSD